MLNVSFTRVYILFFPGLIFFAVFLVLLRYVPYLFFFSSPPVRLIGRYCSSRTRVTVQVVKGPGEIWDEADQRR